MSPVVRLERRLDVKSWNVTGTVARLERRDWEPAIVLLAREQGCVTAELVARELLNGRRAVATKLIAACEGYGLLEGVDGVFVPTSDGLLAADTQDVYVPTAGSWAIWAARDPLLPSPILWVKPWDAVGASRSGHRAADPEFIPYWVLPSAGTPSNDESGRPVRVMDLGEKNYGEAVDSGVELALELTVDGTSAHLRMLDLKQGRREVRNFPAPTIDAAALVSEVREAAQTRGWPNARRDGGSDGEWNATTEAIELPFGSTSVTERTRFVRDVQLHDVRTDLAGEFETVAIDAVRIQPRSFADADAWARWRLTHMIGDYATAGRYRDWIEESAGLFPMHELRLPDRAALADLVRCEPSFGQRDESTLGVEHELATGTTSVLPSGSRPTPCWWRLVAPLDWGL